MKLENHVDFFLIHCGVRLHIKIVDDLPALVMGHLAALERAANLADEHLIHVRRPVIRMNFFGIGALGHRDEFFPERGIEGLFRSHRDGKRVCFIAGDIEIQQVGDAFFLFPQTKKRLISSAFMMLILMC